MMIFPSTMKPQALKNNEGSPHKFKCELCGVIDEGRLVSPGHGREDWAVLPEEWTEIEDRRPEAKKRFVIICNDGDCQHRALERTNVG